MRAVKAARKAGDFPSNFDTSNSAGPDDEICALGDFSDDCASVEELSSDKLRRNLFQHADTVMHGHFGSPSYLGHSLLHTTTVAFSQ